MNQKASYSIRNTMIHLPETASNISLYNHFDLRVTKVAVILFIYCFVVKGYNACKAINMLNLAMKSSLLILDSRLSSEKVYTLPSRSLIASFSNV